MKSSTGEKREHQANSGSNYLNRELSRLAFEKRVLSLVEEDNLPLLERVKFLSIFARNLDEFFQVRVGGFKAQVHSGVNVLSPDGFNPEEQIKAIRITADALMKQADHLYRDCIAPELSENDLRIVELHSLSPPQIKALNHKFEREIFPVLTPLAVDPAHPFPHISNLSLNIAVLMETRQPGQHRFARVKVPPLLRRLQAVDGEMTFIRLEDLISSNLDLLFPGMEILNSSTFRVTRDADLDLEKQEADDLREAIALGLLRQRTSSPAVRLEFDQSAAAETISFLQEELDLQDSDTYILPGPIDLSHLSELLDLPRPALKRENWRPQTPAVLKRKHQLNADTATSIFEAMKSDDIVVHHPYESYANSVEAYLQQAADDPSVQAIKHTLYRTSGPETSLFNALKRAAAAGKQVVTLVELKARFDEEANLTWANTLERAGVHIVYGLVGLKTHAKVTLVVRQEGDTMKRYCHIGTGNYHPVTARLYEDVGLFTASESIGEEVTQLFNHLTSTSQTPFYNQLLIAPQELRSRLLALIRRESEASDGRITIKVNNISDSEVIDALYDASQQGTQIDLMVRGICCLRPGIPQLSENIRVRSTLGEFLEHSRIYRFGTAARGIDYYIGSSDLMPRNLSQRVEVLVPIMSEKARERIEEILETNLRDDALTWALDGDGGWARVPSLTGFCAQEEFKRLAVTLADQDAQS